VVEFSVHDHVEPFDGFLDVYKHPGDTGKLLGHVERLRKETLNTSCTGYSQSIFFRKFFHPKDGDDVLKFFLALQQGFYAVWTVVMVSTQAAGGKAPGRGIERIDGRIHSQPGDST